MTFVSAVEATIRRQGLLCAGDRVVVAVSGGPDSMALLTALVELRERLGLWLTAAHLDHGLRDAAGGDARFVATQAAALGMAATIARADVAAERRGGESVEAAARRVRYAFLARVADEAEAGKVAVGHTADDQVETILEGLLRGGELGALCGMPVARPLAPSSRATVIRPLLDVRRQEVLAFLAERGVAFRTDESNADPAFERNAVRHELLPVLRERLGQGFDKVLLELAERARELSAVVAREAAALVGAEDGAARLDAARLAAAPRVIRREAIRRACTAVEGPGEVRRRAIDGAERLLTGRSGREADLGRGLVARRSYGELVVTRRAAEPPQASASLDVPGRVELPEVGLWVSAEALSAAPGEVRNCDRWQEVVDLDRVGERLIVRTRRPGDRFEPLGVAGSKKLKDLLIDARVPRAERERTLVVEGRGGIVWVVGLRLAERAKVTPDTRRFARLRAGPLAREERSESEPQTKADERG